MRRIRREVPDDRQDECDQVAGPVAPAAEFVEQREAAHLNDAGTDGKEEKLSNAGGMSNGTVSGRSFTIEDLEKMLDIVIEVDQVSMTATVTSN